MNKAFVILLTFFSLVSFAQSISVRAVVKDAISKEPVISASIAVKGTALGTVTNEDGIFQMTVGKDSEIVIASLGYKKISFAASSFTSKLKLFYLTRKKKCLKKSWFPKFRSTSC